ncbi:toll/interleukin-1 receptor domain-containing adapter protein isoform X3 [Anguilla anguilla]|uniref:toll/interleukin-1 receptor domain-containing adapter protein isoform X3 n=1 Tax=Anguilla anguilla TaxID=7936 RepID=UPI0015B17EAE|nr:toll/interleukin-1 receptor domain-containing adapter protein isoform X3 [Anguilla anguilla]
MERRLHGATCLGTSMFVDPTVLRQLDSWFRRLLKKPESDTLHPSSALSQEASSSTPVSHASVSSVIGASTTPSSSSSPSLQNAAARWSRSFDVCVCHSSTDVLDAQLLASRLEAGPHGLRCFLPLRDSTPGGAVPTELCEAVRGSHCWALLITPAFLVDPWCRYQMHQALTEAPTSNRIIPLLLRASRSDYPTELCFYYYIDLNRDPEQGYARVYRAVLNYLSELCSSATGVDRVPSGDSQGDPRSPGSSLTDPGFSETPPSSTREPPSQLALTTTESEFPELEQGHSAVTKEDTEERDSTGEMDSSL